MQTGHSILHLHALKLKNTLYVDIALVWRASSSAEIRTNVIHLRIHCTVQVNLTQSHVLPIARKNYKQVILVLLNGNLFTFYIGTNIHILRQEMNSNTAVVL